jgi:hypothetical protein
MWKSGLKVGLAALLSASLWAATPAHPGMLNYVEGQVAINGAPVTMKSVGSAEVEQGQVLETQHGKAEILLTPGVFLRLSDNSALRMDSAGLANTSVELLRGEAMVEATDVHHGNNIQVTEGPAVTTLEKNGIYKFDANSGQVAVYDGKADVHERDNHVELKKGHEVSLAALTRTEKFDTKQGDDLYQWSSLRSEYLSDASIQSAQTVVVNNGGWWGGGWYWNQGYGFYSWLPGDGYFMSPFGWGFYAPSAIYYAPVRRYHYNAGPTNFGRGNGFNPRAGGAYTRPVAPPVSSFHGGGGGASFGHAGGGGFGGGGFGHGGGGGHR